MGSEFAKFACLLLVFVVDVFMGIDLLMFSCSYLFNGTICLASNYLGKARAKIGIWKTKPKVALNVVNNK